jgi:uncharacterized protein YaiE (UPF0345 family)
VLVVNKLKYKRILVKKFENVEVELEGNSYFDGAVTSRTVNFTDGSKKTLGFMLPGEYEFGTQAAELMEITSGELEVKLPSSNAWISIKGGESFNVPANSKFNVKIKTITDYCCSYL